MPPRHPSHTSPNIDATLKPAKKGKTKDTLVLEFSPRDLSEIRFSYSPIINLTVSYRTLMNPAEHRRNYPWVRDALNALGDIELPYMEALMNVKGYVADFITQPPTKSTPTLEEELQNIRDTPRDVVLKYIRYTAESAGPNAVLEHFENDPQEAMAMLLEELQTFWDGALAPHWSRMQAILENDVLHRARQLATEGPNQLLTSLNGNLRWEGQNLTLSKSMHKHKSSKFYTRKLEGKGLQLVPAVFGADHLLWQTVPEWQTMMIYGARGAGTLYDHLTDVNEALEITLGTGRARVLMALIEPASVGELAQRLDVTPGAISQHLARLTQAGLVENHRSGSRVFYRLSERGKSLLKLFG